MAKKESFFNRASAITAAEMLNQEQQQPSTLTTASPEPIEPANSVSGSQRPSRKGIPLKAEANKKSKRLQLVLTPSEFEKLKAWAEAEGRSVNGLISHLINTH